MNTQLIGKRRPWLVGAMLAVQACLTIDSILAQDQPDIVWSKPGHSGICPVAFSPNGRLLAAGTSDNAVRLWRVADGRLLKTIAAMASPTSVAFSPDGTLLAAGGFDDVVRLWRLADDALLWHETKGDVVCVAFSADGTLATWASDEPTIELWRVPEGTLLRTLTGRNWSYYGVAFSPDGSLVVAPCADSESTVGLWRVSDETRWRILGDHGSQVRCTAFSADGAMIVSGGDDAKVKLWRVADGALLRTLDDSGMVWSVAMSREGTVASAARDSTVKLWRASDGLLLRSFSGDTVHQVAFSPSGEFLAYARGGTLVLARNPFAAITQLTNDVMMANSCAGRLDQYFRPPLDPIANEYFAGACLAVQPDGKILAGGLFSGADYDPDSGFYRLNADGSLDASFAAGPVAYAIALQPDGRILIANRYWNVQRVFDDGSDDESFACSLELGEPNQTQLVLQPDGKVLLIADLWRYPEFLPHGLVRLNEDGSLDETFVVSTNDLPNRAIAVAVQPDGKILVGDRTDYGLPSYLVRLHPDGSRDRSFQAPTLAQSSALAVQPDGKVIVCSAGLWFDEGYDPILRLNPDGSRDSSFYANAYRTDWSSLEVSDIVLQPDGKILIGGAFTEANGAVRNDLARLNPDGTLDETFVPNISVSPNSDKMASVMALARQPDGGVIIAGDFWQIDGTQVGGVARLFGGTNDCAGVIAFSGPALAVREDQTNAVITVQRGGWNPGPVTVGYYINSGSATAGLDYLAPTGSMTIHEYYYGDRLAPTGMISFGSGETTKAIMLPLIDDPLVEPTETVELILFQPGGGATLGATTRTVLSLYDEDALHFPGAVDPAFMPGLSANDLVQAVLVQPDGKVLIGGNFSVVQGVSRRDVARLNADGSLDTSFNPGLGVPVLTEVSECVRRVRALALQPDGKVIVGGEFTNVNGVLRQNLARLNADGSLDPDFNAEVAPVYAVAIQPDGKVVTGGYSGMARFHADGSRDMEYNALNFGSVYCVAVLPHGRILAGGYLGRVNDTELHGVVRLNADGMPDLTFTPPALYPATAYALVPLPDGKVLVGGWLEASQYDRGLLRLHANGTLDTNFHTTFNGNPTVFAIARQPDGRLIIGGDFDPIQDTRRLGIARLNANGTLDPSFIPGTGMIKRLGYACISDNIRAVAIQPDGMILAAGKFTSFNGYPYPALVRLRGDNLNQPGALLFSAPSYAVSETGGVVNVTVKRVWGTNGALSAVVRTEDLPPYPNAYHAIPATAGLDYVPVTQAVHFAAGDVSEKSVSIPILDDLLGEYWGEFFLAVLDHPTGGALFGDPAIARVGISENDVVVEFDPADYRVSEVAGTVSIAVWRKGVNSGPLTVQYFTRSGSATEGSDFTAQSGSITFPAATFSGNYTNRTITLTIRNDSLPESDETFTVVLTNLTGGAILGTNVAAVTIQDDDVPPLITRQPASQRFYAGQSAVFSVEATGTPPLSFQWLFNGDAIASATNAALTLSNIQPAQAGRYAVVVSNVAGTVASIEALLTVLPPGPLVSAWSDQEWPSVASNGRDFLVVWQDARQNQYPWNYGDIYGARVTADGTVLDVRGIPICTEGHYQAWPQIASDGTNYLAVWIDERDWVSHPQYGQYHLRRLYGARISRTGEVLDPDGFRITTNEVTWPPLAVAFQGTDYWVIYLDLTYEPGGSQYYYAINAVRVTPGGAVRDAVPLVLHKTLGYARNPAAASLGGELLVVWDDNQSIRGLRVNRDGIPDPAPQRLATGHDGAGLPAVAASGTNYYVAWLNTDWISNGVYRYDFCGVSVSRAGRPQHSQVIVSNVVTSIGGFDFRLGVAASESEWVVTWAEGTDLFGARIDPDGSAPAAIFPICTAPQGQHTPAVAGNQDTFLAVWEDTRTALNTNVWNWTRYHDIYGARITRAGSVVPTNGFLISSTLGGTPVVTWGKPADIAYGTPLGARQLNATANEPGVLEYHPPAGTVLNAGTGVVLSVTFTPEDTNNFSVVTANVTISVHPVPLIITADHLTKYHGQPNPTLTASYRGLVAADGPESLDAPVVLATPTTSASPPGVYPITASGARDANYTITHVGGTLTVLSNAAPAITQQPPSHTVYAGQNVTFDVSATGTPPLQYQWRFNSSAIPDATSARLTLSEVQFTDAGAYSVVVSNPRGAVTSADAVLTVTPGLSMVGARRSQESPAVATDGQDFFVVWRDERNGHQAHWDLYGARVTAEGQVLDPNGIPLYLGGSCNTPPAIAFDGTNYLVAWGRSGVRVSRNGEVLSSGVFPMAYSSAYDRPAIAFNGTDYVVAATDHVWEARENDIRIVRVSPAGVVYDTNGTLAYPYNSPTSMAAASLGGETLVIWTSGWGFWGVWVDQNGMASEMKQYTNAWVGAVAIATLDDCYFVAWTHVRYADERYYLDVMGTWLSREGYELSTRFITKFTNDSYQHPIAVAAAGSDCLVTWEVNGSEAGYPWHKDIYGARLSRSGAPTAVFPIVRVPQVQMSPAVAFQGTNALVVWQDGRHTPLDSYPWDDFDVYGARVTRAGEVIEANGFLIGSEAGGAVVITWATPADIVYGTRLSEAQLNAQANMDGGFDYLPSWGSLLEAGFQQPLSVTFTASDSNYEPVSTNVFINVLKAPLAITADAKTKYYGQPIPELTASYAGFILLREDDETRFWDGPGSLDSPVVLSTLATTSSPVGTYPIVPSGAADANYDITFVNGTLYVVPGPGLPGSFDANFNATVNEHGAVRCLAEQADGKLLVGGFFSRINGVPRLNLARLESNGSVDSEFDPGDLAYSLVRSIAVQPDGKILVAGYCNYCEGYGLARLNSDGSRDHAFYPDSLGMGSEMAAVAVQSDGKVLVAGFLSDSSWFRRYGVARFNADGSTDAFYLAEVDSAIMAMVVQPDGKIVLGGYFEFVNGELRRYVARLNPDGSVDSTFTVSISQSSGLGGVVSIALQPDGKIVLVGGFDSVNGVARDHLVRLNPDGSVDPTFVPQSPAGWLYPIALQPNGKILCGGPLVEVNGVMRDRLVRLDADGSLDPTFDPEARAEYAFDDPSIEAILVDDDGGIIVGGHFDYFNGVPRTGLVRLNGDSVPPFFRVHPASRARFAGQRVTFSATARGGELSYQWWFNGAAIPAATNTTLMLPNLQPVHAGRYAVIVSNAWGQATSAEAILTIWPAPTGPGSLDVTFDLTAGGETLDFSSARATVSTLAVQPDGKAVIGGRFSGVHGKTRNNLARLHADGTLDLGFDPGFGANGAVYALALQPDGRILVGGTFTAIDARPLSRMARLNFDGTLDTSFVADVRGGSWQRSVSTIVVQEDGKIMVGGNFSSVNDTAMTNLARLMPDGSVDLSFNPAPEISGAYYDYPSWICPMADGRLLVGGYFEPPNPLLVRLNADGSRDASFNSDLGGSGLRSGVLLDTGQILVGGNFQSGSAGEFSLALIDSDGTLGYAYPNYEVDGTVTAILREPDGHLLVEGYFNYAGGYARRRMGRFDANLSIDPSFDPGEALGDWFRPTGALGLLENGGVLLGSANESSEDASQALVRLKRNGTFDTEFHSAITGAGGVVNAVVLQPDGKVIAGGYFTQFNNGPCNSLVRLIADGALDPSFQPELESDAVIGVLALQPDGKLVVGGRVGPANLPTERRGGLRRLNPDGTKDSSFTFTFIPPEDAAMFNVLCLALQPDGKIVIGGEIDLPPYRGLARLNPDGTIDTTFEPPLFSIYDQEGVHSLALQPDGRMVVGCYHPSGEPDLLRLMPDGRADVSFSVAPILEGSVDSVLIQPDGKIVVGGAFYLPDYSGYLGSVIRFNPGGSLDSSFIYTNVISGRVLALQADGRILASGLSTQVYRLNTDGSPDPTFEVILGWTGVHPAAQAIVVQPDGQVLIGGSFSSVNGIPINNLARLNNDMGMLHPADTTPPAPGTVVVWGRNQCSQTNLPPGLTNVVAIAAGGDFSLALRSDGTVVPWGCNDDGQLNLPPDLTNVRAISAGSYHSIALKRDGTVVAWGPNTFGQVEVPPGLTGVVAVACGEYHTLVLKSDGTVTGWGRNWEGQCDPPANCTNVTAIAAGGYHSLALRRDGTVVLWGRQDGLEIQAPAGLTNVVMIACGTDHALALKADRTLNAWAWAAYGYDYGQTRVPARLTNVVRMVARSTSNLGLRADGVVIAWGEGHPEEGTVLGGLSNVVALAGGWSHCLALIADGAPSLLLQPDDRTAFTGTAVDFAVVVRGAAPLDFQWQFQGTDLSGATSEQLVFPQVQLSDAGQYRAVATNAFGAVTSRVATLTVVGRAPYIVRQPTHQSGLQGLLSPFEVVADGSRPLRYQWRHASVALPGATNATLAVGNLPENAGDYSVVIANDFGSVTSAVATLTVLPVRTGAGSLDFSFDPTAGETSPGIEEDDYLIPIVNAMALQADGKVIIAGWFDRISGAPCSGVARLNPDGTLDPSFRFVCTNNLLASGLVQQPDQKLLFVGRRAQTSQPLSPYTGLVRLNPDGSFDPSFTNPWPEYFPSCAVVALQLDGKILVGGECLVRFQADGTPDATFHPPYLPLYDGAAINTLAVQPDGKIVVAGTSGIGPLRLNPDGSQDFSFVPGVVGDVNRIVLQPDGRMLFAAGLQVNGRLVRLYSNGAVDPSLDVNLDFVPYALALQPDGCILVAGQAINSLDPHVSRIYRFHPGGGRDWTFQAEVRVHLGLATVGSLLVQRDGQILVGGVFTNVNGFPAVSIARLNGTQTVCRLKVQAWTPVGPFPMLLTGVPGAKYELHASTDLRTWTPLMTVTNLGGRATCCDPGCTNFSQRFYRARRIE